MFKAIIKFAMALLLVCALPLARAQVPAPTCVGKFMNPITDICWSCIFPIRLAGIPILTMSQEDNNSSPNSILCFCSSSIIGIPISFWEPARMVETVRSPYCFPSLGGLKMDVGIDAPAHGRNLQKTRTKQTFYNVHWYLNPMMFWMEALVDHACLEQGAFDIAYFTEVDPLWGDSTMTFILNPDAALFANIIAQAACTIDCVAASAGWGRNELFWCAGCQGSMYPLVGWVGSHHGGVQASSLLTQRMTNKMHRSGLMRAASGSDGMCNHYIQPIMDKTNYKYQMTYPVRQTEKINGKCCQPFGRTTALWGMGKEFPYRGEDFVYQIFRKRDCCLGAF